MTDPTLRRCVAQFLQSYRTASTRRAYERVLLPFVEAFPADTPLAAIRPTDLDAWYTALPSHWRRATVNNRTRSIKRFFNWCIERGYIHDSPARYLRRLKVRRSPRTKAIPEPVIAAIFKAAEAAKSEFNRLRDPAILALLETFGPRRSDIAALRLRSIDWEVTPPRITFYRPKTGREDSFILPPNTAALLHRWHDYRAGLPCGHDFLFINNRPSQDPLSVEAISTLVKRLSERVTDGRMYGPHSFRHRKGQSLADARVPPDIVQAILGHEDVLTTIQSYYNTDADRIAFVVQAHEHGATPGNGGTENTVIPFPRAVGH